MPNFITGLDIGTSNIKAIVADQKKDGSLELQNIFRGKSEGMRRGFITDVDDAARAIHKVLSLIRDHSPHALKNVYVNIGGANIKSQASQGIVAVSRPNSEIYQDDIDRVVRASESINLSGNRVVLHTIKRQFVVDHIGDIADPTGMVGTRLEVDSLVVDAFHPNIRDVEKCMELAGTKMYGPIFNPLAASKAVLSKNQKELGVLLVDIGAGTTSIAVYEENKLIHTSAFPVGAGHVTNDIAVGLKTTVENAEAIKLSFGYALSKDVSQKDGIELKKIDSNAKGSISRRFLSEIIQARMEEIFDWVDGEVKMVIKSKKLPAGVVLTGGGAKLPGLVDLAKQELKLHAQIGIPDTSYFKMSSTELETTLEDPELVVAAGLVLSEKDLTFQKGSGSFLSKLPFQKIVKAFLP